MTARRRISDMMLPVDTASAWPDRAPRGVGTGIENEWLGSIRTPTELERRKARRYLLAHGHADLLDVLGLSA